MQLTKYPKDVDGTALNVRACLIVRDGTEQMPYVVQTPDGVGRATEALVLVDPYLDANFYMQVSGGNPLIKWNPNTLLYYDRTSLAYVATIAGTAVFTISSTAITVPSGSQLVINDSSFNLQISGGKPIVVFDVNDFDAYDRALNERQFIIGGTTVFKLSATGARVTGTMVFNNDSNFVASIVGGNPRLTLGATSFFQFDRTSENFSFSTTSSANLFSVAPTKAHIALGAVPIYADNAAATAGGLNQGDLYRTATGQLMIRY